MEQLKYFLKDYDFDLPVERIAKNPPQKRGESKLLVLKRESGGINFSDFKQLADFLPSESLLVFNDVKVTPARIYGQKISGSKMEALLLELPSLEAGAGIYDLWCLAKPGRRLKIGDSLQFYNVDRVIALTGVVTDKSTAGLTKISFDFLEPPHVLLAEIGHMPLPPYLKRPANHEDSKRYQTVYAQKEGAIAAPTAGLHFTDNLLIELKNKGHQLAWLTLWVGLGTFAPLTWENVEKGKLHEEKVEISEITARQLQEAKASGRPIISVGTTTARAIEWSVSKGKGNPQAIIGACDMFIKPGYDFYIDGLITNFHLPATSLLLLVAAFSGQKELLTAYQQAIDKKYNFYSYGEAMLIY